MNAVDAKGRVSVPHSFRQMIENRCRDLVSAGSATAVNTLKIGEHPDGDRLQALDLAGELDYQARIKRSVEELPAAEQLAAIEARSRQFFGPLASVSFDDAGRMSLPPMLRAFTGIDDLALFLGTGLTIEIWNPITAHAALNDDPRTQRVIAFLLKERGVSL